MLDRCSTCGQGLCNRSPMCAVWQRPAIAAGADIHTGFARLSPANVPGMAGGCVPTVVSITAPWVIVSTDAYSTGPLERCSSRAGASAVFQFGNAATVAGPPVVDPAGGARASGTRRRFCRPSAWIRPEGSFFGSVGALRNTGRAIHVAWAKRALKRLFPQLGSVEFECEWFGKIGMTDNALPRFYRFCRQGGRLFPATNGRGIAPGTVFGRTLAQLGPR
jgi:glycine/D-amino acid oxidase-like deaminating enzyme